MAVLVSGSGTNLQAILDSLHGHHGIEVACVASSRAGAPALQRARDAGVAAEVFAVDAHEDRASRDRALGDWLAAHDVGLVVLAGFMELLGTEFIRRFRGRIVNIHPSLLPAFPGLRAIEQAVAHGVRVSGVTVHFVDEGMDSGPIILQRAFELPYHRDIEAIEAQVHAIEHELLPRAIRLIAGGAVSVDPDSPRHVIVEEPSGGFD